MIPQKDKTWIMRTYAGHSTPEESNALYHKNLAKGQTGLSIAFDLPTQIGYDSDHILSKGEVGKVGVPIGHIGDMRRLFNGIPLEKMNTSMTINATAAWLLALYIAVAEEQEADISLLQGTTQNDILKEYLSRGTYIFPPEASVRLTADIIEYTYQCLPKWNPLNICSYHLQEAGATPIQEAAFALANAMCILDTLKVRGNISNKDFGEVVGRMSFFVNAGIQFITGICKMRSMTQLWDEITHHDYNVEDEKYRRFRYGVQVNSLNLTEQQPENNVFRILLEMLSVTLSKDARARAVQLPAWNEALGLPRAWDQQWSLRMQQILAFETDLLNFDDIFNGSYVIDEAVFSMKRDIRLELDKIKAMGGAIKAIENAYMKQALVESNLQRMRQIENGEQIVVGVNKYTETEPSPLTTGENNILIISQEVEKKQIKTLTQWRENRDNDAVQAALQQLEYAAKNGQNIMISSIACAKAGVTTGEWGDLMRQIFGEYKAPTGVAKFQDAPSHEIEEIRQMIEDKAQHTGRRLKLLLAKPGLDGHSNGVEQIAVRARECGFDVVYEGIRQTPADIVNTALEEDVHLLGISILSGSHMELASDIMQKMQKADINHIPVFIGGIIPDQDAPKLKAMGIKQVYTPKNFDLNKIMKEIVGFAA